MQSWISDAVGGESTSAGAYLSMLCDETRAGSTKTAVQKRIQQKKQMENTKKKPETFFQTLITSFIKKNAKDDICTRMTR